MWTARIPFIRVAVHAAQRVHATQRVRGYAHMPGMNTAKATEPAKKWDPPIVHSVKGKLTKRTIRALVGRELQFKELSEVQARIMELMPELARAGEHASPVLNDGEGRDLLVKARTGTGKTMAFLIPAVEARLNACEGVGDGVAMPVQDLVDRGAEGDAEMSKKAIERRLKKLIPRMAAGALILSPTRELATQIAKEAEKLVSKQRKFGVHLFVGGASRAAQLRQFRTQPCDLIVATPGRLMDLLGEENVREALSATQTLVLDEADLLLEMGFRDEIQAIIGHLPSPEHRHTMLFSATISPSVEAIARATMHKEHRFIDCVGAEEDAVHTRIPQYVTMQEEAGELLPHVLRLIAQDQLEHLGRSKVMVFTPTTKLTEQLSQQLQALSDVLPAGRETALFEMHSNKRQMQRDRCSSSFRRITTRPSVLVTSDVSARGVDYPNVTRVIQLGVPASKEMYVHRVGRTGRSGKLGRADLVLMDWESGFVTWQLDHLPLQRLAADELEQETLALAQQRDAENADAHAAAAAAGAPPMLDRRSARRGTPPAPFSLAALPPAAPRVERAAIADSIARAAGTLDEEDVRATFSSLLGYYLGRVGDIRISKGDLVQCLRVWTAGLFSMPRLPHVSEHFLQRLGVYNSNNQRGDSRRPARSRTHGQQHGGRGGAGRGSDRRGRFGAPPSGRTGWRPQAEQYERFGRS
ncbi:RNA helicase [Malassezia sp. CBS 17886]|nr:RNA helicase [Malassezia sp. CBS 17886]